jgi:nicotinamidase-related amidase
MTRRSWIAGAAGLTAPAAQAAELPVRGKEGAARLKFEPLKSAIILCDVWDKHWCRGASERVEQLAPRIAEVVAELRRAGMTVIHAPSDTMQFYASDPARMAALALPRVPPPKSLSLPDPKLPIDDSDGGCDTEGDTQYRAWSRQHPAIRIEPGDFISDNGEEVYAVLKARAVETLFVAGVHTNMCILNRSFAIKQMTRWGVRCVLLRDLTDAMYDPKDAPYVSHVRGTELVIEHIEKHWCPSARSADLVAAARAAMQH